MRPRARLMATVPLVAALGLLSTDTEPSPGRQATPSAVVAPVGALFRGSLADGHSCTATVLDTPPGDLVLTAAHCVSGTAVGYRFVPGYDSGRTPYGVWRVTAVFVDAAWRDRQDPGHDVAVLRVAAWVMPRGQRLTVERLTGGYPVGPTPPTGTAITDIAYNAGVDDAPIACATTVQPLHGYPAFVCGGFIGGSSGSPWLREVPESPGLAGGEADTPGREVVGVIGGRHQGGCRDWISYSSQFAGQVSQLVHAASAHHLPSVAPAADDDGC